MSSPLRGWWPAIAGIALATLVGACTPGPSTREVELQATLESMRTQLDRAKATPTASTLASTPTPVASGDSLAAQTGFASPFLDWQRVDARAQGDGLELTVNALLLGQNSYGGVYGSTISAEPGSKIVLADLTLKYQFQPGQAPVEVHTDFFVLTDAKGLEYHGVPVPPTGTALPERFFLSPGGAYRGVVAFIVPTGMSGAQISFENALSGKDPSPRLVVAQPLVIPSAAASTPLPVAASVPAATGTPAAIDAVPATLVVALPTTGTAEPTVVRVSAVQPAGPTLTSVAAGAAVVAQPTVTLVPALAAAEAPQPSATLQPALPATEVTQPSATPVAAQAATELPQPTATLVPALPATELPQPTATLVPALPATEVAQPSATLAPALLATEVAQPSATLAPALLATEVAQPTATLVPALPATEVAQPSATLAPALPATEVAQPTVTLVPALPATEVAQPSATLVPATPTLAVVVAAPTPPVEQATAVPTNVALAAAPTPANPVASLGPDPRFSGWPNDPSSTAWVGDNGYQLFARTPLHFVAVGAPRADPLLDGVVLATFHKVGGPLGGGYGLIVRDQGPGPRDGINQDGNYYVMEAGDSGLVGMWRRDGDRWVDLLPWTPSDAVAPGSAPNQLAAIARGNALTFMVNGIVVGTAEDPEPISGGIGVFVGGDMNRVALDDFSVAP